jgi:hypothetical protein
LGYGLKALEQTREVLPRELVLPNPEHLPASGPEQPAHLFIPGPVAQDLGPPERRPVFRPRGVLGASVSAVGLAEAEAPVYKHRGLALGLMVRH